MLPPEDPDRSSHPESGGIARWSPTVSWSQLYSR